MSVNKAIILGNVGQTPELRATVDGREIATLSLATSEHWYDKETKEKKEKTEWHRIVVFSQGLVNIIKKYVKKGTKLYIEGQIQTRKWTDNKGIDRYSTEIVLQNFNSVLQLLDSPRKDHEEQQEEQQQPENPEIKKVKLEDIGKELEFDEIPF
jgi:single-strand DNA-binding protein